MSEDSAAVPAPQSVPQPVPQAEPLVPFEAGSEAAFADAAPATAALAASPATAGAAVEPKRRRLRWLWWTTGSLFVTSLAGLCAYLAVVAHQWSVRVDDLTTISQDLGTRVADQTAATKVADAKVSTLQSQLDASNARITDLANEEANAVDHEAVWINLVDSMISCADERQNLIDALTTPNSYFLDGRSKAQVEDEITAYCDGLKSDYTTYKAEIGK